MTDSLAPPPGPQFQGIGLESSSATGGVSLARTDQETALMAVQSQRMRLVNEQISVEIDELQAINKKLERLGEVLAGLKSVEAQFSSGADYDDEWDDARGGWSYRLADQINRNAALAGVDLGFSRDNNTGNMFTHMSDYDEFSHRYLSPEQNSALQFVKDNQGRLDTGIWGVGLTPKGLESMYRVRQMASDAGRGGFMLPDQPGQALNRCDGGIRYDSELSEIKKAVNKVKGVVDELSSVQQDHMLRLQAMMNRRNEAADTITQYLHRMQEGKSDIVDKIKGT